MIRVSIETFGCTYNKADSQIMAGVLAKNGMELVDNVEDADVIIAKVYANGRAVDDSVAYVFDVTKLEEYVQRVKMIEVTPEP